MIVRNYTRAAGWLVYSVRFYRYRRFYLWHTMDDEEGLVLLLYYAL